MQISQERFKVKQAIRNHNRMCMMNNIMLQGQNGWDARWRWRRNDFICEQKREIRDSIIAVVSFIAMMFLTAVVYGAI